MAPKPTIQLRTIFLLFFCIAVGLMCANAHSEEFESALTWTQKVAPRPHVYRFLLYTGAAAIVIGLLQQIQVLARFDLPQHSVDSGLRHARAFAIGWRSLIAIVLCGLAITRMSLARELFGLPASETFHKPFPDTLTFVCAIVVLGNSVRRWSRIGTIKERRLFVLIAFAASVVILSAILTNSGMLTFLVHIALGGVEHSHSACFQRPGAYPDLAKEGLRLFWISTGAIAAVLIASAAIMSANVYRAKRICVVPNIAIYAVAIAAAAAFCFWYYTIELPQISPDLAGAGFVSSWVDRLGGAALISIVVAVIAYRTAKAKEITSAVTFDTGAGGPPSQLHESVLVPLLLFGAAFVYLYELLRAAFNGWDFRINWDRQILDVLIAFLRWPESYIALSLVIVAAQFLWLRWKQKDGAPAWRLTPVDGSRLLWNWVALTLLAAVALPALSIYSFRYWLGPWYTYGPR